MACPPRLRTLSFTCLAVVAAAMAPAALAQSTVDKPTPKVGDVAEYDKFVTVPCKRWEVTSVDAGGLTTTQCGENTAYLDTASGALVRIVTRDGDKLVQFTPRAQGLQFPLRVGKTWKGNYEGYTNDDGAAWKADVTCNVKAAEKVKVAAGEFEALRVECEDAWSAGNFNGVSKTTSWYAPKAGAAVKSVNADAPKWNMELQSVSMK